MESEAVGAHRGMFIGLWIIGLFSLAMSVSMIYKGDEGLITSLTTIIPGFMSIIMAFVMKNDNI